MRIVQRLALIVLLVSACAASARAAAPSDAEIARDAERVLSQLAKPDGPGAVMLVARGDRVIYRAARGMANIELGVRLRPDQVFRIASITKMLIATTTLKLEAAGKLRLDDRLALYFPEVPNAQTITLRQLLSHTAGIGGKPKQLIPFAGRRDLTTAEQVTEISQRDPDFAPGTRFSYSNGGFILLGAVIEKVTGRPWYDVVEEQLLKPLQLVRTKHADPSRIVPDRVSGYTLDRATGRLANANFISMTIPAAAGAMESTADDLFRYMRALVTGRAVEASAFSAMTTAPQIRESGPPNLAYGLGTYIWQLRGTRMIGHTGQIDGFASVVAYLPDADITIVALGNNDSFDAQLTARRLAGIVLGRPYPDVRPAAATPAALEALAGAYRFDAETLQRMVVRDGRLYGIRGSRDPLLLQLTSDGRIHFDPDLLSYFEPVRDSGGNLTGLNYFAQGEGPARFLPRLREP